MTSLVSLLLEVTDPVVALLVGGVIWHVRRLRDDLERELEQNRDRVERLEDELIDDSPTEVRTP